MINMLIRVIRNGMNEVRPVSHINRYGRPVPCLTENEIEVIPPDGGISIIASKN